VVLKMQTDFCVDISISLSRPSPGERRVDIATYRPGTNTVIYRCAAEIDDATLESRGVSVLGWAQNELDLALQAAKKVV
jgi:hypothetical protein